MRDPHARYACLYRPPAPGGTMFTAEATEFAENFNKGFSASSAVNVNSAVSACDIKNVVGSLEVIAQEFSPRYERHGDALVSIDVGGLERLLGTPRTIAHELRRDAADRGVHVHVAIAGTRIAAIVLALARPGITVVDRGNEAAALAPLPIGILEALHGAIHDDVTQSSHPSAGSGCLELVERQRSQRTLDRKDSACSAVSALKRWGVKTLGELARLPSDDLAARLGQQGLVWQAVARGEDVHPLVPTLPDERFESTLELDWPIEGLEPLSFVLTRLLEPLSIRLERRDRGAAVLHVRLGLVTKAVHARSLELPAPLRDVRTLRTLALVDLESHPPAAAIDRVTVEIDPTPGRVLQHTLFTRAYPTPDEISTLLARLGALMSQDRLGAPSTVETYRPGAFEMTPFSAEHDDDTEALEGSKDRDRGEHFKKNSAPSAFSALNVVSVLRRCRQPVPARVVATEGRPVRVTTDRRGFAGGSVVACAGPWRSSGDWWRAEAASLEPLRPWDRDEWDVALSDGGVYRVFQDRETNGWFIDGIVD